MFPGQPHGRFSVLANEELRIRDVRREDEGVYVCSALSVAGSSIAKAELRIALADDRPPPIIRQGEWYSLSYTIWYTPTDCSLY